MANLLTTPWAASIAYQKTALINGIMINVASDVGYYHLGNPTGAELLLTPTTEEDDGRREMTAAYIAEITCPSPQASATEIALLGTLAGLKRAKVRTQLGDTTYFDSSKITANTVMGLDWKLECDKKFRTITWKFKSAYQNTEVDDLCTASPVAVGTPTASDVLYTLQQAAVFANQPPGGITGITWTTDTGDTYCSVGDFMNAKYSIYTDTVESGGARMQPSPRSIFIDFDADLLETNIEKLNAIDVVATNEESVKITHMDAKILSLTKSSVNAKISLEAKGGVKGNRLFKLHVQGSITDFTTWAGLWS